MYYFIAFLPEKYPHSECVVSIPLTLTIIYALVFAFSPPIYIFEEENNHGVMRSNRDCVYRVCLFFFARKIREFPTSHVNRFQFHNYTQPSDVWVWVQSPIHHTKQQINTNDMELAFHVDFLFINFPSNVLPFLCLLATVAIPIHRHRK